MFIKCMTNCYTKFIIIIIIYWYFDVFLAELFNFTEKL